MAVAAAGTRQLGDAVRVPRSDLHLALRRDGRRHGRDGFRFRARVHGGVAGTAVGEGAEAVGDRAVGEAICAVHRRGLTDRRA